MEMESLIGKVIKDVHISSNNTVLNFNCEDGAKLYFAVEGDCCSSSWIEHTENVEGLVGAKVTGIEETDYQQLDGSDYDVIRAHFYKITLENRQPFGFEFRNSSNGYYDGYITEMTAQQAKGIEFRRLVDDF